jgi:hypothetical protein
MRCSARLDRDSNRPKARGGVMNRLQPSWAKGYPVAPPGVGRPQLVTYPQSPFSGPACCCDVAYLYPLYQAFSQPTGPGRLWIVWAPVCRFRSKQKPQTFSTRARYQKRAPRPVSRSFQRSCTHLNSVSFVWRYMSGSAKFRNMLAS